jgi:ubiquinone/menaquinone biosynthesis C-methylase UbiE
LIKRTSKNNIEKILKENPNWKILDIGCGYTAHELATTICDIQDLSNFYKDKNFFQIKDKVLPFEDKEFDFVITSHVLEHVDDLSFFISELERVSKRGYIELPTKLEDNLVFENKKDHLWHMEFDDDNYEIIISKKSQFFEPIITVSTLNKLRKYFRSSLVYELIWEKNIDYRMTETETQNFEKINILNLCRKYFSKKIRMIFK